jgi:hypothetical protein
MNQLQDEIKNAKIVLQDRNIRSMYCESLREYKKDIEAKKIQTKSSSDPHKRTQSASKSGKNSFRPFFLRENRSKDATSTMKSVNTPKAYTSISNTFDITGISLNQTKMRHNSAYD